MSYIKKEYCCPRCGETVKYYWTLPNSKFERFPDSSKYICANQDFDGKKLNVSPRCRNCGWIELFYFSENGELLK